MYRTLFILQGIINKNTIALCIFISPISYLGRSSLSSFLPNDTFSAKNPPTTPTTIMAITITLITISPIITPNPIDLPVYIADDVYQSNTDMPNRTRLYSFHTMTTGIDKKQYAVDSAPITPPTIVIIQIPIFNFSSSI